MSDAASKHLKYLARRARDLESDATDYTRSYSANSFVPYYSQRMSAASVLGEAQGILKQLKKAHGCGKLRRRYVRRAA